MRENHTTHKKNYTMPFTLSHPVAAIPLRRYLGDFGILSALFIGAMAPDFVYMLPEHFVFYYRLDAQSLIGLFKVCLPMGIGFLLSLSLIDGASDRFSFPRLAKASFTPAFVIGPLSTLQ